MRFVFNLLVMLVVALGLGFGLSYFALNEGRSLLALQVGPWRAWPEAGAERPDPYTRAALVRDGALQLGRSEGIEFTALTDSEGQPLRRECRYRVHGITPIASFWTLSATTLDGVNIAPQGGRPAIQSTGVSRDPDGSARIYVGRTLSPGNWFEITGQGPFQLVLTLYDTSGFTGFGSTVSEMPEITRETCA